MDLCECGRLTTCAQGVCRLCQYGVGVRVGNGTEDVTNAQEAETEAPTAESAEVHAD